jgi:hypothetical protein
LAISSEGAARSRTAAGSSAGSESRIIADLDGAVFEQKIINAEALGLEASPGHQDFAADAVAKRILVLDNEDAGVDWRQGDGSEEPAMPPRR